MDENRLFIQISDTLSQGKLDQAAAIADEAIKQFPKSSQLQFIFAAIAAQSEQYDLAIQRYQEALGLNPELHIARFQLGLLLATLGQNEASTSTLTPLCRDNADYLGYFAKSLVLILTSESNENSNEEQLIQAVALLKEGILMNQENLHLNDDMRAMMTRVKAELEKAEPEQSHVNAETSDEVDQSHLLDIYKSSH